MHIIVLLQQQFRGASSKKSVECIGKIESNVSETSGTCKISTVATDDKKLHFSVPESGFFLGVKIKDSRHFQLAIHIVFHAESESAVRNYQFLHPEEKIKKNQPTRVSISYRKISYHMSPL